MQGHSRESRYLLGVVRQSRQPCHLGESFGHLETCFAPLAKNPIVIPEYCNVVQHQGDDDLIDIELCFQDAGDECVGCSAKHTEGCHQRDNRPTGGGIEVYQRDHDDSTRQKCSDEELSFRADIPKPHTESQAAAQTDQHQGSGFDDHIRKGAPGTEGGFI